MWQCHVLKNLGEFLPFLKFEGVIFKILQSRGIFGYFLNDFLVFLWTKHDCWNHAFQSQRTLPITCTNDQYSWQIIHIYFILHVLNMTIGVMHFKFNHKTTTNYMHKPLIYLTKKKTYFTHSSCIKYESFNHACHTKINIIYGRNTKWL